MVFVLRLLLYIIATYWDCHGSTFNGWMKSRRPYCSVTYCKSPRKKSRIVLKADSNGFLNGIKRDGSRTSRRFTGSRSKNSEGWMLVSSTEAVVDWCLESLWGWNNRFIVCMRKVDCVLCMESAMVRKGRNSASTKKISPTVQSVNRLSATMSSTQLRTLLKPPCRTDSQKKATETINLQFHCFEDLRALDASVIESERQQNTLRSNVWNYFWYPCRRTQ